MKGQALVELAVLAIMAFVGVIAIYFPTINFFNTATITVEYQYNYDNSQSALMSMMPITVIDSLTATKKPLIELLGEYVQLQSEKITPPDTSPISHELSNMANGININCYQLSADTVISQMPSSISTCQSSKYTSSAVIPLPYNPSNLVKTVTLVIQQ